MRGDRPRHRILSSSVAFFAATAPILGFYLGIVADLGATWWLGVNLLFGVFAGLLYGRRAYSLSRLWNFVWVIWKGLVIAVIVIAIVFRLNVSAVQGLDLQGRTFVGGLAFVVFVIVYGASYGSVYVDSA